MIPPETLAELTKLRDRVAYLEAELALVKDRDAQRIERVVEAFAVTVSVARLLIVLAKGGVLTREQALGLELSRVDDCDYYRSLDSIVKRARRSLPWLKVRTIYGLGYILDDPQSLKRIRAAMGGHQ